MSIKIWIRMNKISCWIWMLCNLTWERSRFEIGTTFDVFFFPFLLLSRMERIIPTEQEQDCIYRLLPFRKHAKHIMLNLSRKDQGQTSWVLRQVLWQHFFVGRQMQRGNVQIALDGWQQAGQRVKESGLLQEILYVHYVVFMIHPLVLIDMVWYFLTYKDLMKLQPAATGGFDI